MSANESYQRSANDIAVLIGIGVSKSTQSRQAHRQRFEIAAVDGESKTLSVDGGNVRLRTPLGQPSLWRNHKGANLYQGADNALVQANNALVDWVNQQPLSSPLVCLGDRHDGI